MLINWPTLLILIVRYVRYAKMNINLNNKKFKPEFNSRNGEVSDQTLFSYNQKDNIVWAEYSGGQIVKGNIVGKVTENHIEFVYQHMNKENELMTGNCKSYPEKTENGKNQIKRNMAMDLQRQ